MPRNKEFEYEEKLEKARDLFWEKGYHATSIHDIVDRMGLNRSSVYNSYGNKQQLFLKCLESYAALKATQYRHAGKNAPSAFEALSFTIRDVVEQTMKDKKACLIVRTVFELGNEEPAISSFIKKNAEVLESIFRELVIKAKAEGELKNEASPDMLARYILTTCSSFYMRYVLTGNKKEVNEMIDFLIGSLRK
ncbi:TetR/AcrR family transcriptional regulator [Chitinophaga sp. G-6-1-13]|uniref:TetR/AcrR family transcriptional regulator n=1 Tax=Chitinophaga fulva TaxID=2728842 RepID=A0A848GPW5_9BACT|nr:TetR/AcrR family transcriptional regulator [Chitinophaga fulva]NML39082.1 TetR/AcrR family transcriptional regulator [Chitinophaga fulva]